MNTPPLSKKSSARSIRESFSSWSTAKPARRNTKSKTTLLAGPEYNNTKRPVKPAPELRSSTAPQLFSSYRLRSNSARTRDLDLHSEWQDAESVRYEPSPSVHRMHYNHTQNITPLQYKPSMNIEELMHLPASPRSSPHSSPRPPSLAYTPSHSSVNPRSTSGNGERSPRSPRALRDMYKALPPPPVIHGAEDAGYAKQYELIEEYLPRVEAVKEEQEVFEMPSGWGFEGAFGAGVEVGPFELDTPYVVPASAATENEPVELAGAEIAELGAKDGEAEGQRGPKPVRPVDEVAVAAPTAKETTPSPTQTQAEDTAATPTHARFHRRQDSDALPSTISRKNTSESADGDTPTLPRFHRRQDSDALPPKIPRQPTSGSADADTPTLLSRQDSFALPAKFPRRLPVPREPPAQAPPTAPSQPEPTTSILTEMDAALSAFSLTTAEREFVLRASSNWLSQPADPPPTPPESPAIAQDEKSPALTAPITSPAISQLEKVHVSERFDPEMSWLCFSPSGSESSSLYTVDEDEDEEDTEDTEAGKREGERVASMYTLEEELRSYEAMNAGEKEKEEKAPSSTAGDGLEYF